MGSRSVTPRPYRSAPPFRTASRDRSRRWPARARTRTGPGRRTRRPRRRRPGSRSNARPGTVMTCVSSAASKNASACRSGSGSPASVAPDVEGAARLRVDADAGRPQAGDHDVALVGEGGPYRRGFGIRVVGSQRGERGALHHLGGAAVHGLADAFDRADRLSRADDPAEPPARDSGSSSSGRRRSAPGRRRHPRRARRRSPAGAGPNTPSPGRVDVVAVELVDQQRASGVRVRPSSGRAARRPRSPRRSGCAGSTSAALAGLGAAPAIRWPGSSGDSAGSRGMLRSRMSS